jgi:hypothetical protein
MQIEMSLANKVGAANARSSAQFSAFEVHIISPA